MQFLISVGEGRFVIVRPSQTIIQEQHNGGEKLPDKYNVQDIMIKMSVKGIMLSFSVICKLHLIMKVVYIPTILFQPAEYIRNRFNPDLPG